MESTSSSAAQRRPNPSNRRPSEGNPASAVFGFPVSENQFRLLQNSKTAESTSQVQREEGLMDPRSTRLSRLQAATRTDDQGTLSHGGIFNIEPVISDEQGIINSGECVEPVSSRLQPTFFHSYFSASPPDILESRSGGNVHYKLEHGAVNDDALYYGDLNEVAFTIENCNKRISCAGPEWSAGRPGNRPIGARDAARNSETCLGPYATRSSVQPYTGHNTREHEASSRRPRKEDQSTSQPTASSSGRPAVEDCVSPATVALHPRRPPYFAGGFDEGVYVWTSIVSRWLEAVQGEPSTQLTYVVSLLRGTAYEWFSHMETRTGCPGDWTTLRHAMLARFGSSIRASRARATLLQMTQGEMTVLEYFDTFESCLAQLEDYDESFYLTKFIFGLRPALLTQVFAQRPATLLEAKMLAETLELTQSMVVAHQTEKKTIKAVQHRGTQERRSGKLYQSDQMRTQKKACSTRDQRQRSDSHAEGCIYAHRGAREASCPERHGPAAVWRSMLRDLPQRDRAGYVRRQGSVMTVNLEALTRAKERKTSADATVAGMSMHPPSVRPWATRVYLCNRLLRRDKERKTRDCVRER